MARTSSSSSPSSSSSITKDAQDLLRALWSAYSATPTNLKIIDLYVAFAVFTALLQSSISIDLDFDC
ncbi:defender against cell death [Trifolium pratense]|uniref:Defender against cell death n=1 Tax=Trifolium pratense TaxID=57577 RepID=A0A2K3PNV4_TRIPR|nr:defender against cell death [Trifolium pratense]